ncbi:MAG: hypothetical protein HN377_09195 [Alphaproteobacteria bacterium]|jgi:hypothetical protein|nr:hypothetical protein [Alphaproteobacteria bacterium]MBT7942396.1 hypothetical protein [Alphaproteobacteria bacterium]
MVLHTDRAISVIKGVVASLFLAAGSVLLGPSPAVGGDHGGFQDDVFPILQKHCVECHQEGGKGLEASGLDMSSYEGVMRGTTHGPIVVPGDAFSSNLSALIEGRGRPEINMPHARKPLNRWERHLIRRWILQGAKNN